MRWKSLPRITPGALFIVLLLLPNVPLRAQQERGQSVRLRIGAGREVELYAGSYALVIGVSDYTAGWHDLPGVRDDLPAVKASLEKHGFQITSVLNPTRRQLDDAIGAFIGEHGQRPGNRLLIYFAGHGHTLLTQDGRRQLGYIVPADAPRPRPSNAGEFKRLAISMNEINNYAEQIEANHTLFVFDSCFAGSIFKARSDNVPEAITDKITQPVRQFITAGNERQTVPDSSYFRRAFVAALDGAADDNRDGFITGSELGEYLHREVTNYTKRSQTPQHGKINNPDLNEGDLVFLTPKRESVALVDRCAIAWESIKTTQSETTIENFLRECKDAPQAFAANLRLNELRGLRRPDPPAPVRPTTTALTPVIALPRGVPATALRIATVNTASVDAEGRISRQQAGPVQYYEEDLGGGVLLEMVAVLGDRFQMGSPVNEEGRNDNETQHWVRVSDFWMGRYEVTQALWKAVMGSPPQNMRKLGNKYRGDSLPVVNVSWEEAQEFIKKLNARLGNTNYRLPREAEWEYAARAGRPTPFGFGATITPELENYDWQSPYGKAPKKTWLGHPVSVGSYVDNMFGLFDMHGNVWEWCEDWYGPYPVTEATDPAGPVNGSFRLYRGGGWHDKAGNCRSAYRGRYSPGFRHVDLGFRLARSSQ